MHVPDTGHTPVLSDRNQNWFIHEWLHGPHRGSGEWTVLHAPARERYPGAPLQLRAGGGAALSRATPTDRRHDASAATAAPLRFVRHGATAAQPGRACAAAATWTCR